MSSEPATTDNWRRVRNPPAHRAPVRGRLAVPALAAPARAEYDPPNTRTSWEDGRWGG
ncbi:hypothetical protein [Streptomyces sp. JNUCC 63]